MERWRLSAELSEAGQRVVERLKRTGSYVFLRQVAPRLFDDGFLASLLQVDRPPPPRLHLRRQRQLRPRSGIQGRRD
jgi:hypothetical protein